MSIQDYYLEAIKHNHTSLITLIDFLVKEKKVVSLSDDESALDRYLLPKNTDKMNKLLKDYMQGNGG